MNTEQDRIQRAVVPRDTIPDTSQRNLTLDIAVGVISNQLAPVINVGAQIINGKIADVISGAPPAGKHAKQD